MRRLMLIVAIALLVSGPAASVCAKVLKIIETVEASAGGVVFVKLPGDPSVGYKWRLNKNLSTGLDLVEVDQLGWLVPKRRSIFFRVQRARSVQNIAVRAKAAGQADLAFDYYRRLGGRTYSRTSIVRVIIAPKPAPR
ncbi:MAG: hypothetical protein ACE5FM_02150 [Methyloligellaceae bacterium]